MDSRFCSLTACLKNAKNTKGQSAICEGLEKYKKNTKIQIAFLDVMEKYKKNTKIQSVFFVFYLYFFRISFDFVFFLNTKKIQKKIRMQLLKNTKYKKNTNQQFQKYKIQKKYEPKISKIQNTKKRQIQK